MSGKKIIISTPIKAQDKVFKKPEFPFAVIYDEFCSYEDKKLCIEVFKKNLAHYEKHGFYYTYQDTFKEMFND